MTPKQSVSTIIATATVNAWKESLAELKAMQTNTHIVQHPDTHRRQEIDLENHFFNVVTSYRPLLTEKEYTSLCNKIELLAGTRFVYRP